MSERSTRMAERQPAGWFQLQQKAVATGERDLLFALTELSYVAADQIRRAVIGVVVDVSS